jgi:hypothetical protein
MKEIDEDIFMCWYCGFVHFESERCPKCNAGPYNQCSTDRSGKSLKTSRRYAEALRGKANQLQYLAEKYNKIANEYDPPKLSIL